MDGVYDADPEKFPQAKRFDHITYQDVLARDLRVMDSTAITLCRENKLPILVFNMNEKGNLTRLLKGEPIATVVTE